MLALSDGGEDAVTEREFDLRSSQFVPGGFALPRGKQGLAWQDQDTLWVSREWSPGEMTSSGYPYVLKRLRRGEPLAKAQELFRGLASDVGVFPLALHDAAGHQALIVERDVTFFEGEYQLQTPAGLARLGLPRKVNLVGLIDGRLVIELREDWQDADGTRFAQGSLVAVDLAQASASPGQLRASLVYAPEPRHAFAQASASRHHLLVTELDDVKGRAYVYTPGAGQRWSRRALALPDYTSVNIVDTDLHSDRAFLQVTGFLTPSALWLADLDRAKLAVLKTLPARFDASRHGGAARSRIQGRHKDPLLHRAPKRREARWHHADDPDGVRRIPGLGNTVLLRQHRQTVAGAGRRAGPRQYSRRRRIRARLARGGPQDASPVHLR
jgi:prolyl oligopeptidase